MAKLLVSVRSRDEALAAVAGGADVIDVKEPLYGPPPLLLRMVEAGLLGKKSGKGFYSY